MNTAVVPCAENRPSIGPIFEIMLGPVRMALLNAALDLNIADALAETGDPRQMADRLSLKADEQNLVYFLDALVALGFAKKTKGGYANTPFADAYLRISSPVYLGSLVRQLAGMQHRNLDLFAERVRLGPEELAPEQRLESAENWKQSVRRLVNYQKAGMAEQAAELVADLPEYPNLAKMLDMGCGPGIVCQAVVSRHPRMTGVLCDFPPVIEVALKEAEAAGLASRITAIRGDYNTVDLGKGYDLIWASHSLYYARDLVALLDRARQALNPGGVFMSLHEGLTHQRTSPDFVVLSRLSLALEGQDVSFALGEIASSLIRARFESVQSRCFDMAMGPVELVIARKSQGA